MLKIHHQRIFFGSVPKLWELRAPHHWQQAPKARHQVAQRHLGKSSRLSYNMLYSGEVKPNSQIIYICNPDISPTLTGDCQPKHRHQALTLRLPQNWKAHRQHHQGRHHHRKGHH